VQLAGEALPLFQRRLAAGLGEKACVVYDDGGLIGDGRQEDPLVLAGLLSLEVAEVDRAQDSAPGDERHDEDRVPLGFAHGAVDGSVEGVLQHALTHVGGERGLARGNRLQDGRAADRSLPPDRFYAPLEPLG